jgi:hypothetical protein
MKLFFILLFTILLNANSDIIAPEDFKKQEENHWNYFGTLNLFFADIHKTKKNPQLENYNEKISYNSLQLNVDYFKDNFYFSMAPYVYIYYTESGNEVRNGNHPNPFVDRDFFFRSLFASYTMGNITIGGGVLPYSNSYPMQYSMDYYQDGEGLSILGDIDPLALFIKYQINDDHKLVLSAGYSDTGFISQGDYFNWHNIEDSYGVSLTQTIHDGKFKYLNDFRFMNLKFDGIDMAKLYSFGTGILWDDAEYSGWSIYNSFGVSIYKNNNTNAQEAILKATVGYTPAKRAKFPDSFAFDNKTYTGAANLFGVRKDLDIFELDSFLNVEWFHTFSDWESANKGSPYNSNCTQVSNIRDNSLYVNYGVRINELTTFKINYTYLQYDEFVKVGAPSSVDTLNSFGPQRTYTEIIKASFTYKF